ncbi:MAG: rhodanese-like domain-containing protein [Acidobacteriota bacterium]|nr:rhodanese-like domain-containing protein [Acidobacteriota bacterium]
MSEAERRAKIEQLVAQQRQRFPAVPSGTVDEVRAVLAEPGVVLVDVREANERRVSMIPGAIGREEFERRAAELSGSKVVTYCTVGYRSASYANELAAQGWDVLNMAGSILAWSHAGGELVDPEGNPTRRVHVYGPRWNLAADGYEPVW